MNGFWGTVDRLLGGLCLGLALGGGGLLLAAALMTTASVLSRALWSAPISGDFELMELALAVAVAAFLPLAQWHRAFVAVDVLARRLPDGVNSALIRLGDGLMAGLAGLMAARLAVGVTDMRASGEITLVLGLPRWWGLPAVLVGFALLALVAARMSLGPARTCGDSLDERGA